MQHLESLNDRVAELTGVRVRETFPDQVLAAADEVVLMDLTPEALIQRLREGKVYGPERIQTALNSFFKVENLSALREVALRQVAEEVESRRLITPAEALGTREEKLFGDAPQAVARSACSRWSRRTRPHSGSCAAPGARRSASAATSTSSMWRRPESPRAARSASASRRCDGSPPCSAPI